MKDGILKEDHIADTKSACEQRYPLTMMQRGIWIDCQLMPESPIYNIAFALKISGKIKVEVLQESIKNILARYDIWRTVFLQEGEELYQEVQEDVKMEFSYFDMRDKNVDQNTIATEGKKFAAKIFDLEKGPLVRFALFQCKDTEFYFVFAGHHLVMDGDSELLFCEELSAEYKALTQGTTPNLTKPEMNFGEYAKQCITGMKSKRYQAHLDYWKDKLADAEPVEFPTDHPRGNNRTDKGGLLYFHIPKTLDDKVREYATIHHCSENVVLFAAFNCLLHVYSNSESIVVGTPLSTRIGKQLEKQLGCFINNLVIHTNITKKMTFDTIVSDLRRTLLGAYAHNGVSLEELVQLLNLPKDPSRTPFYNISFNYNPRKRLDLVIDGCECEEFRLGDFVSVLDFTFQIFDDGQSFLGLVEYNKDLYEQETIERILERFENLLERYLLNPCQEIGQISMLSGREEETVLHTFNDTGASYPKDETIVSLFEKQVEKHRDSVAVLFEEEEFTYGQLNAKANQLARKLKNLGVKPNDFVAIKTVRSFEMLIGIFGILKAGGAYVPIDPTYPEERITYILRDSSPRALLIFGKEEGDQKKECSIPVIDLSEYACWDESEDNPEKVNSSEDTVYCIYTSGTTGEPKGVPNKNQGLINRIMWMHGKYPLCEKDVVLQKTTFTFDVSVWEILWWSLVGARVVMLTPGSEKSPEDITNAIDKYKVTHMHFVPSMLNMFLEFQKTNEQIGKLKTLKYVFASGEALSTDHLKMFDQVIRKEQPITRLINFYGPTEASIDVTYFDCESNYEILPIGKPIHNTQIYIMQQNLLCGIGMPGELCIAGDGLAKGYLNKKELTEEKFVKNPFGEGRLYHTGDLARWLPDGNIEYLGRIDDQVKVRGFRIELGEIASRLREFDEVKDCAVIARTDMTGTKDLCAYLVGKENIDLQSIKSKLEKVLPGYMIPPYMMQIDSIPVTSNGKLDRRALPLINLISKKEYKEPQTETEKKLCQIFEELLGVEKVGILDSFFELGGHSLKATMLVNRIAESTQRKITLKDIFQCPTPEELAKIVDESSEAELNIPVAEEKKYYPMSSAQKRIYLICQMDPEGILYNLTENIRLIGEVDVQRVKNAIQAMVDRYEILRTRFLMHEGELVQEILDNVKIDFAYLDNVNETEEQLISSFAKPFDLSKAPLLRAQLVKYGESYLLSMDFHHIVLDGVSFATFYKELNDLYNGKTLEPVAHQFKDYSEWMNARDLSKQEVYWKEQFQNEIPVLDMPLDYMRPQEQSYKGAKISNIIPGKLLQDVKSLSSQTGTTEFMIFLSTAMVMLSKYSRQEDIVIGTPISGRTHHDTENMIGMFVNTLAMRGRPEGQKTYLEFLNEIKETCLRAFENQEYPFEELVDSVNVVRDLSRNPLFDVMMILQNNEITKVDFRGARAKWVEGKDRVSKFDLSFIIEEKENGWAVDLEYCTALFTKKSAEQILVHYIILLEKLIHNPSVMLKEVGMTSEDERELILKKFNHTAVEYPKDKTIVELFEEQVRKTPDNIAVVFEKTTLTYAQLNAKANMLAHTLVDMGIRQDDFVTMMTDRSLEMIVGILGVLKAGGAYVPMDPTYPEDRIQYMLQDCNPKAVLCYTEDQSEAKEIKEKVQRILAENADAVSGAKIQLLDLADTQVYEGASENLPVVSTVKNLAYCIYTSGTTGQPKGVLVEHGGVSNLGLFYIREHQICDKDRVLMFANYVFDASVTEITSALLSGAQLHVASAEMRMDTEMLEKYIREKELSIVLLPPVLLTQLNVVGPRLVITAGSESSRKILEQSKNVEVYSNDYGPTEGTVGATFWKYEQGDKLPDRIPIGKPISNKKVYIVANGNVCGIGVPGELCIGGVGIARGYLNRPELTAEKFVENPFDEGRMYHTGDLARWLPDGNIEYLGRIDEQVKIRGFRIELGEIDSRLREIEEVIDCAVIAREDENGEKAIYAYVVSEEEIEIPEIRKKLGKVLPYYMVPSYMTQIDRVPMTKNGKLDRKSLPEIEAGSGREYVAPRNEIEEMIEAVWAEVLHLDKVSVCDSFVELGGHSLIAMLLIQRINQEMGTTIKLSEFFIRGNTIEDMVLLIEENIMASLTEEELMELI